MIVTQLQLMKSNCVVKFASRRNEGPLLQTQFFHTILVYTFSIRSFVFLIICMLILLYYHKWILILAFSSIHWYTQCKALYCVRFCTFKRIKCIILLTDTVIPLTSNNMISKSRFVDSYTYTCPDRSTSHRHIMNHGSSTESTRIAFPLQYYLKYTFWN